RERFDQGGGSSRSGLTRSGRAAHALETMRNGCFSSRLLVFGDPRRKNNFKVIHALPMPISATLPNAAIKYRLSHVGTSG
ncbi:MAG: hypothetical protein WBW67_15695, partial [Pseudolabrys sp.]